MFKFAGILFALSLISALLLGAVPVAAQFSAQKPHTSVHAIANSDSLSRYALLNINNALGWLGPGGISNHNPADDRQPGGFFLPSRIPVVWQDGIVWGAQAFADREFTRPAPLNQLIRIGGATYRTSTRPGRITGFGAQARAADPRAESARVYRIRRDYAHMSEAELRRDAADVFGIRPETVTAAQMQAVHDRYARDWQEWPVPFGAPFIDRNGNGVYDPPPVFSDTFTSGDLIAGNYDEPGISGKDMSFPADQVLWTVFNDLDREQSVSAFKCEPLGLEIQVTVWAHKGAQPWGNYYMKRVRLINKGGVIISEENGTTTRGAFWLKDMYFCQWTDIDLGYSADDLAGCDTTLSLGYVYNSVENDQEFVKHDLQPAAVGYALVQGPRVPAPGHTALFDFREVPDWRNLPMTAFIYHASGDPYAEPAGPYEQQSVVWYRMLKGLAPDYMMDIYFPFPPQMKPGPFPLAGDPVAGTGHIDGQGQHYSLQAGERRIQVESGPFNLAPGDTQEVVLAFAVGQGADRLASITVLRHIMKQIQLWYPYDVHIDQTTGDQPKPEVPATFELAQSYPNPFTERTQIRYTLPRRDRVRVTVYNLLGREVAVLENRMREAGTHAAEWDGRDKAGRRVPPGIYFYRLRIGEVKFTRQLVLLR